MWRVLRCSAVASMLMKIERRGARSVERVKGYVPGLEGFEHGPSRHPPGGSCLTRKSAQICTQVSAPRAQAEGKAARHAAREERGQHSLEAETRRFGEPRLRTSEHRAGARGSSKRLDSS